MAGERSMGTKLALKMLAPETADTVLANLTTIGELASESEEVNVTTLDSPGGNMEFVQGAKDNGSVEVEANNVYDGQAAKINSLYTAGTVRDWLVTYNSGATLAFEAYVSAIAFGEATTDGVDKMNFTLRVTGLPTYTEV